MLTRSLFAAAILIPLASESSAQYYPPIRSPYAFQNPYIRQFARVALPNPLSNPAFAANYYLRQSIRPVAGPLPYLYGANPYGNVYLNRAVEARRELIHELQDGPNSDTPGVMPDGTALVPGDIHVLCPTEDTKLSINGTELEGEGINRRINVPNLPVGPKGQFTLTAKYKKDGKEVTRKRVVVLNGENHGFANMQ